MKIEQYIVQNNQLVDTLANRRMLNDVLFNVNMRLYRGNKGYKFVVEMAIDHMKHVLGIKFENYPLGRGISGANVGIPFNIVVIRISTDNKLIARIKEIFGRNYLTMINPKITSVSKEKVTKKSNCGSLLLKAPISVQRSAHIDVTYYDIKGNRKEERIEMPLAATVQHEIDHSNGVLITDRELEN